MFNIETENYSAVYGANEKEVNAKIEKLMRMGKITEVVSKPHCCRLSSIGSWCAYVRSKYKNDKRIKLVEIPAYSCLKENNNE